MSGGLKNSDSAKRSCALDLRQSISGAAGAHYGLAKSSEKPMEYHVRLGKALADLAPIEAELRAVDPMAQVDIDTPKEHLRVAAHLEPAELVSALDRAGYPVLPHQVVQLPSICCGGCGG